jgi:hypothetical protein
VSASAGYLAILAIIRRKSADLLAFLSSKRCYYPATGCYSLLLRGALVLANAQGELSPLEIGLHVLRYVETAKGGRGEKGGLSAYAERTRQKIPRLTELRQAALVYETLGSIQGFSPEDLLSRSTHLTAIHAAPREAWETCQSIDRFSQLHPARACEPINENAH